MAAPVQLRDIESAARAAGLACRGGFHPRTEDAVPDMAAGVPALTVVLLGFTGASHWPPFAASTEQGDGRPDPLDRWSRRLIDAIGASVGAIAVYPMDGPPWLPFQRWAMRAEPVHPSPLGVLIHPEFGLWHAYRGALLFAVRLSLPEPPAAVSPCTRCVTKPCLSSCPIGAVMPDRYDHVACRQHVASPAGRDCLAVGCVARRACPVGVEHRYDEQQTRFHMQQFALRIQFQEHRRMKNRQWTVARPEVDAGGLSLVRGHFAAGESEVPAPKEGEILIRTIYLSPDAMNHAWVRGMPGKFDPLPVGSVMRGGIGGVVVESKHADWKRGDRVTGFLDWADYSLSNGSDHMGVPLQRVPADVELGSGLSALGMTGLCAWLGLTDIGHTQPGDTVLISGASGGIGVMAGQIAKALGARAIGIAGGADKCRFLLELGFDAAVDYRQPDLAAQLAKALPGGANVFFDNVGGAMLDAALLSMSPYGRVVICGAVAHYGAQATPIYNHMQLALQSLTMQGFFYFNLIDRWPEGRARIAAWIKEGAIRDALDIADGFDIVPEIAVDRFAGGSKGRKLIRINPL